MNNRLVCLCNFVTESEIREILKKGVNSTSEIQEVTRAGTTCGKCLPEIDQLVEDHLSKQNTNPQYKIEF